MLTVRLHSRLPSNHTTARPEQRPTLLTTTILAGREVKKNIHKLTNDLSPSVMAFWLSKWCYSRLNWPPAQAGIQKSDLLGVSCIVSKDWFKKKKKAPLHKHLFKLELLSQWEWWPHTKYLWWQPNKSEKNPTKCTKKTKNMHYCASLRCIFVVALTASFFLCACICTCTRVFGSRSSV